MPVAPTIRNDPTLLQAAAAEAPNIAAVWALVENATLPRQAAMLAVAKGAAVLDEGFIRALLVMTQWYPIWQENVAVRPYDAICLRWWKQALLTDTDGRVARIAGRGIRWLIEHDRVAANAPEFAALEAYALRGTTSSPREPRSEAAWSVASAAAHGYWNMDRLADWWAHTEQKRWGHGGGDLVLKHASLNHVGVFMGQIEPGYDGAAVSILVDRADVRLHATLRPGLLALVVARLQRWSDNGGTPLWKMAADARDDFEECIGPYLANPEEAHPGVARMLETNPIGVGSRLGRARLEELVATSPDAACRAQAQLALAQLGLGAENITLSRRPRA